MIIAIKRKVMSRIGECVQRYLVTNARPPAARFILRSMNMDSALNAFEEWVCLASKVRHDTE
jgi:hypothetical protein